MFHRQQKRVYSSPLSDPQEVPFYGRTTFLFQFTQTCINVPNIMAKESHTFLVNFSRSFQTKQCFVLGEILRYMSKVLCCLQLPYVQIRCNYNIS